MALFQSGNPVNNQPATAFIINGGEKEKEEEEEEEEEEKREREFHKMRLHTRKKI